MFFFVEVINLTKNKQLNYMIMGNLLIHFSNNYY